MSAHTTQRGASTRSARRRTTTRAVSVGLAAALALTACASGGESDGAAAEGSDEPVTLEFWTWSLKGTDERAQAVIDEYESQNPGVTVNLSEVGGTADTSSKLLAAHRAGDTPDVVQVEYRGLPSLVVAGAVRDITDDVAEYADGIEQNIWDLTTLDGRVYGVPQDIGPMMITYRADLFEEYGIDVPTTWAEYAEAAEAIRAADPEAYIAAFAADQVEFFAAQAAQAGAEWWSTDGTSWSVGIDSEESLATADFWQDLVERDLVSVEPLLTPEWNAKVNDGKILSWTAAAWVPSVIYSVAEDTAGAWESAPLPQWEEGNPAVPFMGGSTYLVPEASEHAEEAAKFAAWLGASDEGSKLLLGLDLYPAGNGGRQASLEQDPPLLMPQQEDFYEVADQVIQDTTISVTWGPNVNLAQTTLGDAMNEAARAGTPFRDAYRVTQEAIVADLQESGYDVTE